MQYQWPSWLHAQTEKQRIIWGYKILFLDVLFPMNLKKIIFVGMSVQIIIFARMSVQKIIFVRMSVQLKRITTVLK